MFDKSVRLPSGLEIPAIRRAIKFIKRHLNDQDFIDLYLEQANILSAIVGMFGTKALSGAGASRRRPGEAGEARARRHAQDLPKGGALGRGGAGAGGWRPRPGRGGGVAGGGG